MSFKNTMKLFASNFSLVWKQVLYFFVCFLIFFILSLKIAQPIIDILKINGVGSEVGDLVDSIYALQNSAYYSFFDIIKHIFNLIVINFKEIYLSMILLFFTAFLLPYILFQMSVYNLSSIMFKRLSMNMNVSFVQNFLGNLKESTLYALTNLLLSLPFWTAKILFLELYFIVSTKHIFIAYLGLVCLSAVFILLDAIKTVLFTCYTGYCIENNKLSIKSFSKSIPLVWGKGFWSLLSSSIIIGLISIVSNGFVALFTFFAGLIVSIPAIFVLKAIFNIVVYFNKTGQRYYLSNNFIFNPTKYIVKQDENPVHYLTMEEPVEEQVVTNTINNIKQKNKRHKHKSKKSK